MRTLSTILYAVILLSFGSSLMSQTTSNVNSELDSLKQKKEQLSQELKQIEEKINKLAMVMSSIVRNFVIANTDCLSC